MAAGIRVSGGRNRGARQPRETPRIDKSKLAIDLAACRRGIQHRDNSGTAQIVNCVAQELRGEPPPPPGGRHQHHADPTEAAIGQGSGGGDDAPGIRPNRLYVAQIEEHAPVALGLVPTNFGDQRLCVTEFVGTQWCRRE